VDLLLAGSEIIIKTKYSELLAVRYFGSDWETLLIVDARGGQRRISKAVIESITAEEYDDSLVNGALLGLSAGVGLALLLALISRNWAGHSRGANAAFGGILFGLGGMGIGSLIDYHHRGREVIYLARKDSP
jgi:hypothetical protein